MKLSDILAPARIDEKYTGSNMAFLNYMRKEELDYYNVVFLMNEWASDEGFDKLESEFEEMHDDGDYDGAVAKMEAQPKEAQDSFKQYCLDWLERHDPVELPTWAHMMLAQDRLIPRDTWLVHFSDDADVIWYDGFKYGAMDFAAIGLTTHRGDNERKDMEGYNFAFEAESRYAEWAARQEKYGNKAVLFQNSGVIAHHHGDQEEQVVFYGPDVDKGSTILIEEEEGGEWVVTTNGQWNENKEHIFVGDFDKVVEWVINNHRSYHKVLTSK